MAYRALLDVEAGASGGKTRVSRNHPRTTRVQHGDTFPVYAVPLVRTGCRLVFKMLC
jgi:hypothetical protein